MRKHKAKLLVILTVFLTMGMQAPAQADRLENTMFRSGKIYVVAAVVGIVFVLITLYLISLDKKLKKLEQSEKKDSK
jgi:CcmD family protein